MRKLVFYDSTGKVWLIAGGETELAPGCLCMWVDFEGDVELVRIDLTDPDNPKPVFSAQPDSQIGILQKQMAEVQTELTDTQLALVEQYEENLALQEEVTNTQLALTEVYETMLAAEAGEEETEGGEE